MPSPIISVCAAPAGCDQVSLAFGGKISPGASARNLQCLGQRTYVFRRIAARDPQFVAFVVRAPRLRLRRLVWKLPRSGGLQEQCRLWRTTGRCPAGCSALPSARNPADRLRHRASAFEAVARLFVYRMSASCTVGVQREQGVRNGGALRDDCCEPRESRGSLRSSAPSLRRASGSRSSCEPVVSVPVLSKITRRTLEARSKKPPSRTNRPALRKPATASSYASGVARPNAHGQVTTSTAVVTSSTSGSA